MSAKKTFYEKSLIRRSKKQSKLLSEFYERNNWGPNNVLMPFGGTINKNLYELEDIILDLREDLVTEWTWPEYMVRNLRDVLDELETLYGKPSNVFAVTKLNNCEFTERHVQNLQYVQEEEWDKDFPLTLKAFWEYEDLCALIYKMFGHLCTPSLANNYSGAKYLFHEGQYICPLQNGNYYPIQLLQAAIDRIEELEKLRDENPQARTDITSIPDYAKAHNISVRTVWRKIKSGELKSVKHKGQNFIEND